MNTTSRSNSDPHGAGPSGGSRSRRRPVLRSRDDRVVAGVAGGIAEYFDIDAVLVRIAIVVLTLSAGTGLLAYLLAWYFLPEAPAQPGFVAPAGKRRRIADPKQLAAFGVLGVGMLMLFDRMGLGIDGGLAWPLALIGVGVAVLWSRGQQHDQDDDHPSSSGPAQPGAGSRGPVTTRDVVASSDLVPTSSFSSTVVVPSTDVAVLDPDALTFDPDTLRSDPDTLTFDSGDATTDSAADTTEMRATPPPYAPPPPVEPLPPAARVSRRQARRDRSTPFSRASGGLLLTAAGVLALAVRAGWLDGQFDRVVAVALIGIGGFLVAGAFLGRPRGFITLGVLMISALSIGAAADLSFKGGVGDRLDAPSTVAGAVAEHRLGLGSLHLDLSRVPLAGQRVTVTPRVSVGALRIEVPEGVKVVVSSHVSAGEIVLFGKRSNGTGFDRSITVPGSSEGAGTLYVNARVGVGQLEVARVGKLITPSSDESLGVVRPRTISLVPSLYRAGGRP